MTNYTTNIEGEILLPESLTRLVAPVNKALNDLIALTEQYTKDPTPKNMDHISQYWNRLGKEVQCNNRILQFAELSPQMRIITRNLTFSYSVYEHNQHENSVFNYQQLMYSLCNFFRPFFPKTKRINIVFAGQAKDNSTIIVLTLDGERCLAARLTGFINIEKEYVSRKIKGTIVEREPKFNCISEEFGESIKSSENEAILEGFIFKGQFIKQYHPTYRIGLSKTFNFCDGTDLLYYPSKEGGNGEED